MKDNFFTYIGQNPFSPEFNDGIVLGKLSFNGNGSIFSVTPLDAPDHKPVVLDLSYCVTTSRGILPKKKKVYHVKTSDIYAGNAPSGRDDAFSPILSAGSLIKSVYGGSVGSFEKNIHAMQTQLPKGWFMIRLPAGKYQITNAEEESVSVSGNKITTASSSLSDGPVFSVDPGVINYIGNYSYSPELSSSKDRIEAQQMVTQCLGRLQIIDPQWVIVEAD